MRRLFFVLVFVVFGGGLVALGRKTEEKNPPAQDNPYELYQLFVDALDHVERSYVTKIERRELVESALRGVMERLDPYSNYISPREIKRFRASVESEFGGLGIQITLDDGVLKILSPLYGTPAYKAGLLAGDRIVEIEGKSTDGLGLDEAERRLKGDVGTQVTLTVIHPGRDEKVSVTLKREIIHVETVLGDRRQGDGRWDYFLDPSRKIGYVRLTAFSRDTGGALKRVLRDLQARQMQGLILDLRFNPGGLLTEAVAVSDFFLAEGRIVSTKGRNSPEQSWEAHSPETFSGFPLVVLVNRFSASASEIVAACVQDHHRGVIVGERTWGKGSVQNIIDLEDGQSALKLTTATYHRPSGKNIHRFPDAKKADAWGVFPDEGYEVKLSARETTELLKARRRRDVLRTPGTETNTTTKKKSFVDRQLELAVKYLIEELARTSLQTINHRNIEGTKKEIPKSE